MPFPVHLFEEHSSTLPVWWQSRDTPRTAVYLDAHLDLQQTSPEQIQALKACQTLDQVKALESPHHLNPSPRYAFGIENFLYPASRLKLINRLVWVVPPHIPRQYSTALLEYIQQMDGVSFDELSSFKPVGKNALRGTLLGLDITLCDYQQLHSLNIDNTYYLDIDIDYFAQVPEDRLWIDPAVVIRSLLDQLGNPSIATVSRAVSSGFTPLPMHFIADYVVELLQQNPTNHTPYSQLVDALKHISAGEVSRAIEICQQAIRSQPGFAASHFIHSIAMSAAGKLLDEIDAERARAIRMEPAYAFDLSRAASGFPNRHRDINNEQLKALGLQLEQLKPCEAGPAELAMSQLYAQSGDLRQAWQLVQKQNSELKNHSDLILTIARHIIESDKPQQARPLLKLAAQSCKTRSNATQALGDLAFRTGDAQAALEYYTKASEYAPAWIPPIEGQILCLDILGQSNKKNELEKHLHRRIKKLTKLTCSA